MASINSALAFSWPLKLRIAGIEASTGCRFFKITQGTSQSHQINDGHLMQGGSRPANAGWKNGGFSPIEIRGVNFPGDAVRKRTMATGSFETRVRRRARRDASWFPLSDYAVDASRFSAPFERSIVDQSRL